MPDFLALIAILQISGSGKQLETSTFHQSVCKHINLIDSFLLPFICSPFSDLNEREGDGK